VFERHTEKARRVIFFARYEASQFGSPYIESEHLLLGLLRESKALSVRLFASSQSAVDKIRKQVEGHTISGEKVPPSVDPPVSDECKRILLYASEEADALAHKHIGTEHVLLSEAVRWRSSTTFSSGSCGNLASLTVLQFRHCQTACAVVDLGACLSQ
jgi:ATP-dependent Clp protease ATP-binding subunit ClpC